jgi:hypothetical protein
VPRPPTQPAISESLNRAGIWARAHLPPHCVEYLVDNESTVYWLHHAVLGNPRTPARPDERALYELPATVVRWLTPGGLPYAIADLTVLARDIRSDLDVIAAFGTAAVARRRGASACPDPP